MKQKLKIGLIATGDELTQGDILNTNGQYIAEALQTLGFHINQHIIVDDDETNISHAINLQREHHDIIIISGGLGPTSDDRTRFALAKALNTKLIFDNNTGKKICERIGIPNLDSTNHNYQQALFPENSTILANPNGSAAGCYMTTKNTKIFMLPGPPNECLPMFNEQVLPLLQPLATTIFNFKWLLLGTSEGDIAAKLDTAVGQLNCKTGYRWVYPYLEFKLYANDQKILLAAEKICTAILTPYLISKNNKTTVQLLRLLLEKKQLTLYFSEQMLSQIVKLQILTAGSQQQLVAEKTANSLNIAIYGLDEYWQQQKTPTMSAIELHLGKDEKTETKILPIYYRDERVKEYLVELVCKETLIYCGAL